MKFVQKDYSKNYIYFCDNCKVPLIKNKCSLCSSSGNILTLSYPSDIRFAMSYEIDLINNILLEKFNLNPLKNKVLLLNKIPGDDSVLQIYIEDFIFGVLKYDLKLLKYEINLCLEGSKLFFNTENINKCFSKIVLLKKLSSHVNKKKISLDQIKYFPSNIKEKDTILIKCNNFTGYGISLVSSEKVKIILDDYNKNKCCISDFDVIKIMKISSSDPISLSKKEITMDTIIQANLKNLQLIGKYAINFIKGFCNQKNNILKSIYVSFSGGKDSLVCLDLTIKALKKERFNVIYLNTGIDYPETVDFVHKYSVKNNLNLIELNSNNSFWNHLKYNDHPTKDNRWCCGVCKLSLINKFNSNNINKYITIDGKRKYESFNRSHIKNIEFNPDVLNQINIYPIKDWKAIDVWLYIYWRKLNYNILYDKGLERIGCWMCPSALNSEYEIMKKLHPELHEIWNQYLETWRKKHNYKKEYITYGFWRWKKLPPKMKKLEKELNIK